MAALDKALSWLLGGRRPAASHLLLAPAAAWLLIFLVLPALGLVALSFAKNGPYGAVVSSFSVLLGLVYFYLPFTVLPLYGSLEKVPRSLIEAGYDLGANRWTTFIKITFPLSLPGVIAGALLTFIPCLGDFLTAEILGGPRF